LFRLFSGQVYLDLVIQVVENIVVDESGGALLEELDPGAEPVLIGDRQ